MRPDDVWLQRGEIKLDHALIMSEVQLLLAEKRTAYALLRTGVTVSLVPLSLWTVLLATSKLYNVFDVMWLLIPVMAIAVALFALGVWLIWHALQHLRHTGGDDHEEIRWPDPKDRTPVDRIDTRIRPRR